MVSDGTFSPEKVAPAVYEQDHFHTFMMIGGDRMQCKTCGVFSSLSDWSETKKYWKVK